MKKIHFIAIGGAAMHNLAISLHKNGYKVSGSDDQIFDPARTNLEKYGLLPKEEGWFTEKINDSLDAVILGMHARIDNPELIKAKELGLKIYSFPEFIYEHSKDMKRIVVGGSHGKTTITSMILHVMLKCGIDTDFLSGAAVPGVDGNVKLSTTAKYIVIEGDEYLTSPIDLRPKFHIYKPHVAIISGIAWDHINVFKTEEDYLKQFEIFVDLIQQNGKLIFFAQDEKLLQISKNLRADIEALAYSEPEYSIENAENILHTTYGDFKLKVFGSHNMQNIEAARLACNSTGISDEDFYKHISCYEGAYNRLTKIHETEKLTVFRDFAHAPSKVIATVEAVSKQYSDRKVVACLELHTFSSLNLEFIPQYENSLNKADVSILYFNPKTVEMKKLISPTAEFIRESFKNQQLEVFTDSVELHKRLYELVNEDLVLLLMSSGNFDNLKFDDLVGKNN